MANYFYIDADGKQQGPFDRGQLKELVAEGIIKPDTHVDTGGTRLVFAERIPGLFYDESSTSGSPSPGIFDIAFTRFISNTWISIIWCIVIIIHFLGALVAVFHAFNIDGTSGVISLLAVPLITVISLLFFRMGLELAVIFFRIESNTRETKEYLREIKEQLGKK